MGGCHSLSKWNEGKDEPPIPSRMVGPTTNGATPSVAPCAQLRKRCGPQLREHQKAGSIEANDAKKNPWRDVHHIALALHWKHGPPNPMPQNARTRPKDCCASPWRATNAVPFDVPEDYDHPTPAQAVIDSQLEGVYRTGRQDAHHQRRVNPPIATPSHCPRDSGRERESNMSNCKQTQC